MRPAGWLGTAALVLAAGCRGAAPGTPSAQQLVDSLVPAVERAAHMKFKERPRVAMRSRDQVRAYLTAKLDAELPESRARGMEAAYRLFGLLPDSVRLRPLLLDLLSEQVIGYYDADSAMLFGVSGSPRDQLRLVMAHELVHALQGQYLPLDSIFHDVRSNDRLTAAQAILEGQATVASIGIYAPSAGQAAASRVREDARNRSLSLRGRRSAKSCEQQARRDHQHGDHVRHLHFEDTQSS